MNGRVEISTTRLSWKIIPKIWEDHFERMKTDPEYAAWVNGGEIGRCPPMRKK